MKRFLYWLSGHLPTKLIQEKTANETFRPYLERYYLFTFRGKMYYLHRFVGSDPDRALHSHPWKWALSILLFGFYTEENSYGYRLVCWYNYIVGDTFHRVILNEACPEVWTIFIHPVVKTKPWGFAERLPWTREIDPRAYIFIPHTSSSEEEWWKTAPKGRYSERLNADLTPQQSVATST